MTCPLLSRAHDAAGPATGVVDAPTYAGGPSVPCILLTDPVDRVVRCGVTVR